MLLPRLLACLLWTFASASGVSQDVSGAAQVEHEPADRAYRAFVQALDVVPLSDWLAAHEIPSLDELLQPTYAASVGAPDGTLAESTWGENRAVVTELVVEGRVAEALALARERVATLERDGSAPAWSLREAVGLADLLVTILELPPDHRDRVVAAWALGERANAAFEARDFTAARDRLVEQYAAWEVLGADAVRLEAQTLKSLASVQEVAGEWEGAELFWRAALDRTERALGPEHPLVWDAASRLSALLPLRGSAELAERVDRLALARRIAILGEGSPAVAESRSSLAAGLRRRQDLGRAEALLRQSLAFHASAPEHAPYDHAVAWVGLARTLRGVGRYAEALEACDQAERLMRDLFGDDHYNVATVVSERCNVLQRLGDMRAAAEGFRGILAVYERTFPNGHVSVDIVRENLASVLSHLGEHVEAEQLARRSLASFRERFGPRAYQTANALTTLSNILSEKGDLARAAELQAEALDIESAVYGPTHPDVAVSALGLAQLQMQLGRLEEAEERTQKALDVLRTAYSDPHRRVAYALRALGSIQHRKGDNAAATKNLRASFELRDQLLGDHPDTIASAYVLGRVLRLTGETAEAREVLSAGLAAAERIGLTTQARYASLLAESARLDLDDPVDSGMGMGRTERGVERLEQALAILDSRRTAVVGAERERALFVTHLGYRDIAAAAVRGLIELGRFEDALTMAERGRGRVLLDLLARSERDLVADARRAGAEELDEKFTRSLRARAELVEAEERAARTSAAENDRTLGAARRALQTAEADLLAALAGVWPEAEPADASALRAALPPGDALLVYSWSGEEVCLLVAPGGQDPVRGWTLASGREASLRLQSAVRAWRERLATPPRSTAAQGAPSLAALQEEVRAGVLPDDVLAFLSDSRRWIVGADGPLSGVPFDALARERGARTVSVPSGSFLLRNDAERRQPGATSGAAPRALVLGDPVFRAAEARTEPPAAADASALELVRLFGGALSPLPASRAEAGRVAALLTAQGVETELLVGADASLPRLEQALSGARVVHLATHGLVGSQQRPYDAGLALTSPRRASVEDIGFLTLDHMIRGWRGRLKDCDLVVLSACESQSAAGAADAAMSLPWGFFYAGARNVVASLWRVDDEASALLMARFHAHLASHVANPDEPLPVLAALDEAKAWLRDADRREIRRARAELGLGADLARLAERGSRNAPGGQAVDASALRPYADPYYWSSFVLIGAPD